MSFYFEVGSIAIYKRTAAITFDDRVATALSLLFFAQPLLHRPEGTRKAMGGTESRMSYVNVVSKLRVTGERAVTSGAILFRCSPIYAKPTTSV